MQKLWIGIIIGMTYGSFVNEVDLTLTGSDNVQRKAEYFEKALLIPCLPFIFAIEHFEGYKITFHTGDK